MTRRYIELDELHPATAQWLTSQGFLWAHHYRIPDPDRLKGSRSKCGSVVVDFLAINPVSLKGLLIEVKTAKAATGGLPRALRQLKRQHRQMNNCGYEMALAIPNDAASPCVLARCAAENVMVIPLCVEAIPSKE